MVFDRRIGMGCSDRHMLGPGGSTRTRDQELCAGLHAHHSVCDVRFDGRLQVRNTRRPSAQVGKVLILLVMAWQTRLWMKREPSIAKRNNRQPGFEHFSLIMPLDALARDAIP